MASKFVQAMQDVCHIERNLTALKDMPRVCVGNIRNWRENTRRSGLRRRGSKTQGLGNGGQNNKGGTPRIGFEGGQTPFYLRVPKHGFARKKFEIDYTRVNLNRIQLFIDSKWIDPNQPIDMYVLWKTGCITTPI